jgi:hypothetical protein
LRIKWDWEKGQQKKALSLKEEEGGWLVVEMGE